MVWKKVKTRTEEEARHISKRAVEVTTSPLFSNAHTRKGTELNQQADCKIIIEKKLTKDQSETYSQILDEQRLKDDPLRAKSYKTKSKQ